MSHIHVACAGFHGFPRGYWRRLDAIELSGPQAISTGKTQLRWRKSAPPAAMFVPQIDPAIVGARFEGAVAEAAWTQTLAHAERLNADTLLLRTPAEFRPTGENRARLKGFFSGRVPQGMHVAWWAEGLWDSQPEDRDAVCAAAGLVPAVDPLARDEEEELPAGDFIYWRLRGRPGSSTRFSDWDLESVLTQTAGRRAGYIVFAAGYMVGDARKLFGQLGGMQDEPGADDTPDDAPDDEAEDEADADAPEAEGPET